MKKTISILLGLALIIGLLSIASTSAVAQASQKGPSKSGYAYLALSHEGNYSGDSIILYAEENSIVPDSIEIPSNISYSESTNTLTLKNAAFDDWELFCNEMGSDLTINVVGTNSLKHILSSSTGYNGSITITGKGTLTVNKNRDVANNNYASISIIDDYLGSSSLTISPSVTCNIYSSELEGPSIAIYNSLKDKNGLDLANPNEEQLSQGIHPSILSKAITFYDESYFYYCTPKEGSGLDTNEVYLAKKAGMFYWNSSYIEGEPRALLNDQYTIYKGIGIDKLEGYLAIPLKDSKGNSISADLFDIGELSTFGYYPNGDGVATISRYSGPDSSLENKDYYVQFVPYISIKGNDSGMYVVYEVIDIPSLGSGAFTIEDLSFYSTIPEGISEVYDFDHPSYDYRYFGDYTQKGEKGASLKKLADGKYYYFKDGIQTKATLLVKHTDGKYYYVKNGVVTKSTLLFKHTDGKYYYVKNGVITKSTLLFKHTDGKYYYVKSGVVTKSTLLFKHTDGKYYYVKNGVVTKATLLFKHADGKYYYVKNGVMTKSTLLFKHTDKKFYYVKNGVVTKSTLLFKHTDGKYYYVKNGVVTKATLIYKFNGAKRYIKNGVWQSSYTGKATVGGKTYNVKKGNVA